MRARRAIRCSAARRRRPAAGRRRTRAHLRRQRDTRRAALAAHARRGVAIDARSRVRRGRRACPQLGRAVRRDVDGARRGRQLVAHRLARRDEEGVDERRHGDPGSPSLARGRARHAHRAAAFAGAGGRLQLAPEAQPVEAAEHDGAPVGRARRAHLQHLDRLRRVGERLVAHVPDEADGRGAIGRAARTSRSSRAAPPGATPPARRSSRRRSAGRAPCTQPRPAAPPPAGLPVRRNASSSAAAASAPRILRQVVDRGADRERQRREQAGDERPRADEPELGERRQPRRSTGDQTAARSSGWLVGRTAAPPAPRPTVHPASDPPSPRAARPGRRRVAGRDPGSHERCGRERQAKPRRRPARTATGWARPRARRARRASPSRAPGPGDRARAAGRRAPRARTAPSGRAWNKKRPRTATGAGRSRARRRSSTTRKPAARSAFRAAASRASEGSKPEGSMATTPSRRARYVANAAGQIVTTSMCSAASFGQQLAPGSARHSRRARASRRRTAVRSLALAGSAWPPAITSRTRRESACARSTSAAAAATASSKLESGGVPTSAEERASSTTAS